MAGTGVIVNGQREIVPGLDISNYLDDPSIRLKPGEDCIPRPASTWLRTIVLHSTKGLQRTGGPLPGLGVGVDAGLRTARYWSADGRNAGAHLVVDQDGSVCCLADLATVEAYHCPKWNRNSIGIELYQGGEGELYEGQLDACVRLVDYLTRRFGIERQIPHRYVGPLDRFLPGDDTVVGVIGHRDAARNRGVGDPGNAIFNALGLAGYEDVDFDQRGDIDLWRRRQRDLGLEHPDGVPGPVTVAALAQTGKPHGMWVARPGDEVAAAVA